MPSTPAGKNRRVLIIDDNRAIHDDFRKILSPATAADAALDAAEAALFGQPTEATPQSQFEVDSAYQGQEGMVMVATAIEAGRPYAVAFVDVRMPPGWDGVETTGRLWELDPNLQIVLCTAYSDYSWNEMFEELGQRDGLLILKKPFDSVEALQLAHALTEKWSLHQHSRRKLEELEVRVTERTQELAKSLSLLNATLESTTDAIVVVDLSGKIVSHNTKFADTWQFPAGMLARGNAAETRACSARLVKYETKFLQRIKELEVNPEAEGFDIVELKDGRTFERYVFPQRINGKCVGTVITWRDITERKRGEEALRQSEERFSGAFEHAPIGVALISPEGKWLKVNSALCALVGYSEPELLTRTFQEITHPDDLAADLGHVRRMLAGEILTYQMEKRYFHRLGHVVTVLLSVSLVRDGQGQPFYFISQIQDISERKRAENALRESDEKFHQLADNITDAFWIRSADMRELHYLSPAYEQIWGRSVASMHASPESWTGFILPEDRERVVAAFGTLTSGANGLDIEYRIVRPDTEVRWVRVRVFQVRDAAGKLIRHTGIVTDITDRKRAETQLFQSQKMETVGKLAGGIAHEFNSILTAIIGQSELLLADLPAGSPLAGSATEIGKAAMRAAALTRQLLAYGRKQLLQPEALDLNRIIGRMESIFQHLMGGDVDTRIVLATGLQAVKADAGQIEQVILNLAMNARDAMPNGGQLTLETANVSLKEDSAGDYPDLKQGDYVMFAMTDTGTGMSPEIQARIFEPFFTTKDVGQGTGLGLSTCYGIIKQSGGHITVASEPARGTTFKVYLPQVERAPKVATQRLLSLDLPHGKERILLVENDPALREMVATLLRRLGYTVSSASGVEALSPSRPPDNGLIDLLFTDLVMPHLSGKELADRIRALYPHTRILFASAYPEQAISHQGILDKGMALLQKPFTPSALAQKVRSVLDQQAPAEI